MLRIFDSKTREKVEFVPICEGKVGMYVCGPTVYNRIHIGNARTFISFDVIRRYLEFSGYEVCFVQNITDVDDKIIARSNEEGIDSADLASKYSNLFIEDMRRAGVKDPSIRPFATKEISPMIALIKKLIADGHAYECAGDVYFSVRSYEHYGELSNRNVDDMQGGHRELKANSAEIAAQKKDELDFALWKNAKPGEPAWKSPWGSGRPGWHIECSAMSEKYLGLPFDIHGGGSDLLFPHHENERAQSEAACNCTFANYWMHGGMMQINSEKMSKSLGNFLLLSDLLENWDASVLRLLMLQTHYRSPLDFSLDRLAEAKTALDKITNCVNALNWGAKHAVAKLDGGAALDEDAIKGACEKAKASFVAAMDDDFNTAIALGEIFTLVSFFNTNFADKDILISEVALVRQCVDTIVDLLLVFGLQLEISDGDDFLHSYTDMLISLCRELDEGESAAETSIDVIVAAQRILEIRQTARANKDYDTSDAIRGGLAKMGLGIEDTKSGARIYEL